MCGIAGFIGSSISGYETELQLMGHALVHRGPDSSGTWFDAAVGIGLVHRRLAIVDLSETGSQPMKSKSGRYVISFNGEIYNHLEIRKEIQASEPNVEWRGTSDTETILASIDLFGIDQAVNSWVGMFAFALWDRQTKKLTLGRDRFGEKPLYYGRHSNRFWFASELKAMTASSHFQPEVDRNVLALYFRHHYVPSPYSIYKDIFKLEPGTLVELSDNTQNIVVRQYWSPMENSEKTFTGNIADATDQVEQLLTQSIQQQSIADVPVGAFLSGGIDSSLVVALMQKHVRSNVKTFSIGFNDPKYNEAHHARAVATHLKTDHTELYIGSNDLLDLVEQIPNLHDEPTADSSQIPTYLVSKLAREHVTVSLSGDAGDELFGGYTRYQRVEKVAAWRQKLGPTGQSLARAIISTPLLRMGQTGRPELAFGTNKQRAISDSIGKALHLIGQPSNASLYREMISYWSAPSNLVLNSQEPDYGFLEPKNWIAGDSVSEAAQMLDVMNYLPDQILTKVDRASMACSLESRVPMLDHRLAEFVWSLPSDYRTPGTKPKKILINILTKYVPRDIIDRPKAGFGIPIDEWLRGDLKDWASSLLDRQQIESQGYLDADVVSSAWNSFLTGRGVVQGSHIWGILVFQQWLQNQT